MASDTFVPAVRAADVPANGKRAVEVDGKPILVCSVGSKLHAVSAICSHANESLEGGRLGNGWISCPVHGARFDLATGKPKNPPATLPITVYEVRIEGEWIEVRL